MNIIEAEDMVKGLPDQVLFQEAQFPSGRIPQFLAVSEVQRRQDMRQRFQAQQAGQQQPTVKDQILQGGIAAAGGPPPQIQPPPMAPPMAPPMQPQPPVMAAAGGMMPSRVSDAIGSALAPAPSESQSSLPSTGPSRDTVIRKVKELVSQGREMDALVLLRQYGISPSEVSMATGGMTPGGIVYMDEGGTAPNDPGANMLANMLSRVRPAFETIRGILPAPAGVSAADLEKFKPTREQIFDPEFERRRNAQLEEMKQMGIARKAEDIAAAERYLKEAEAPIQAAQDEARQAAISSTLMRLGAGLAAGKPEEGLAAAAQGVEQTMGRAREVAAAERRAARQDYRSAEREAVRGQRAMADQAFAMQAQNITNDENKQIQLINSQQQFAQWAFTQQIQAGRDQRAAFENALNLSIGISKTIDETIRSEIKEKGANQRQYEENVISIYDKVNDRLKNIDEMIDRRKTITDPTGKVINNPQYGQAILDEDGDPVPPTNEYLQQEAIRQTREAMRQFNLVDPSTAVTVTYNGQTFKFPTKEDADKFRAAVGAK